MWVCTPNVYAGILLLQIKPFTEQETKFVDGKATADLSKVAQCTKLPILSMPTALGWEHILQKFLKCPI